MDTQSYIFVRAPESGAVIGFEPAEIAAFEKKYRSLIKAGEDYWSCFSWHFQEALRGHRAERYSALWHFSKPWAELERLRAEAGLGISFSCN